MRTPGRIARSLWLAAALWTGACCGRHDSAESPPHSAPASPPASDAQLCKVTLLVPQRYNDGAAVPNDELSRLMDELYARFGGFTHAGTVRGAYRMRNGQRAEDAAHLLWVALPCDRVVEVRRLAAELASRLRQESVYLEVDAASVEFVTPPPAR